MQTFSENLLDQTDGQRNPDGCQHTKEPAVLHSAACHEASLNKIALRCLFLFR